MGGPAVVRVWSRWGWQSGLWTSVLCETYGVQVVALERRVSSGRVVWCMSDAWSGCLLQWVAWGPDPDGTGAATSA